MFHHFSGILHNRRCTKDQVKLTHSRGDVSFKNHFDHVMQQTNRKKNPITQPQIEKKKFQQKKKLFTARTPPSDASCQNSLDEKVSIVSIVVTVNGPGGASMSREPAVVLCQLSNKLNCFE